MMLGLEQFDSIHELGSENATACPEQGRGAPVVGALPPGLVFTERAVAMLRAYLDARELRDYRIFYCTDFGFHDIGEHLSSLDPNASWDALSPMSSAGEPCGAVLNQETLGSFQAGALDIRRHQIVIARWYWVDCDSYNQFRKFTLSAAPTPGHAAKLRAELVRLRGTSRQSYWQIVHGDADSDEPRVRRTLDGSDDLILAPALRQRMETDILPFFTQPVADLYRALGVPHRRGVLLHGPPGNGKTSLIRLIGARLPQVGAMLLRPDASFNSDALQEVVNRWTQSAPCILVIEDLNWLLQQVNVSTFLNLIDGLDSGATGGLLLIATTNHPDTLDSAINNRPGRFDVVIEMPSPDTALRRQFVSRKLPEISPAAIDIAVEKTDRLSFSHLQEILRASGFRAIGAGRTTRTDEDVLHAVQTVRESYDAAIRGFPVNPRPFGLVPPMRTS